MCVPSNNRTLRGRIENEVYSFFETNKFCDYIRNSDFLYYVNNTLAAFKGKPPNNQEEYLDVVGSVDVFVQKYDSWNDSISNACVSKFFRFLEEKYLFPDGTSAPKKGEVAYQLLCYYLAIIALDYISYSGFS
jgi:hypothetical protein